MSRNNNASPLRPPPIDSSFRSSLSEDFTSSSAHPLQVQLQLDTVNHSHTNSDTEPFHSAMTTIGSPESSKQFLTEPLYANRISTSRRSQLDLSSQQSPPLPEPSFFKTLRTTLTHGIGFACDSYDLFIMSTLLVVINYDQHESTSEESLIATAVLVGSVLGQVLFGAASDWFGRKPLFVATLSLLILGAISSSIVHSIGPLTLFQLLAACRFILGIGIGGEYPLSATVSAESRGEEINGPSRGVRIARTFAMQGVGMIVAPLVVLTLLLVLPQDRFGTVWRLALAAGALPALAMLGNRIRMKETEAFERSRSAPFSHRLRSLQSHFRNLLAASFSWFIFDVVFYAQSLFSASVLKQYQSQPNDENDVSEIHRHLIEISLQGFLLALLALPGYIVSACIIDKLGRRRLQLLGFAAMTVAYVVLAIVLPYLNSYPAAFFLLYGLSFFAANFANTATFVIPVELFPTEVRSTAHGICAASGKMGAVVGAFCFPFLKESTSLEVTLFISAAVSIVGLLWTLFMTIETKGSRFDNADTAVEAGETNGKSTVEMDGMVADNKHKPELEKVTLL